MLLVHLMPHLTPGLGNLTLWTDISQYGWLWHTAIDWSLLAQFETDVFRPAREFFNNFIQSGQVWALLIGLILGYIIRSLTTYG